MMHKRELMTVNDDYLDLVEQLANKRDLSNSRLRPNKPWKSSLISEQSQSQVTSELSLQSMIGLDLKDEKRFRVDLES